MGQYNQQQLIDKVAQLFVTGSRMEISAHKSFLLDLIDSVPNLLSNAGGLGLLPHDTNYPYKAGNTAVINGRIEMALVDTQGNYDEAKWTPVPDPTLNQPGVAKYDNDEEYEADELVSWNGAIYRAKGVTQGNLPSAPIFWEKLNSSNTYGAKWQSNMYVPAGGVITFHNLLLKAVNNIVTVDMNAELNDNLENPLWVCVGGNLGSGLVRAGEEYHVPPFTTAITGGDIKVEVGGKLYIHPEGSLLYKKDKIILGNQYVLGNLEPF